MDTDHPLVQTFSQLPAKQDIQAAYCLPGEDEQPGWQSVASLISNGRLPHILDLSAKKNRSSSRQAQHALWFGGYAYHLLHLPIVTYLATARVPALAPEQVTLRFDEEGDVAAIAWHGRRFSALADDPAANHPDCTVLPSIDALRDQLRQQLILLLTPSVEAVKQISPFSKGGMWALAADYTASIFAWTSRQQGDPLRGVEEARLLASPPSPLRRRRDFILIETGPIQYYMLDRVSCCLYYKVEGGHYCSGCPKRPLPERVSLYESWLTRTYATT